MRHHHPINSLRVVFRVLRGRFKKKKIKKPRCPLCRPPPSGRRRLALKGHRAVRLRNKRAMHRLFSLSCVVAVAVGFQTPVASRPRPPRGRRTPRTHRGGSPRTHWRRPRPAEASVETHRCPSEGCRRTSCPCRSSPTRGMRTGPRRSPSLQRSTRFSRPSKTRRHRYVPAGREIAVSSRSRSGLPEPSELWRRLPAPWRYRAPNLSRCKPELKTVPTRCRWPPGSSPSPRSAQKTGAEPPKVLLRRPLRRVKFA